MFYFNEIQATKHYIEEHERNVPWEKVIELIFSTKNPKKKRDKFEIKKQGYYVLFKIKDNVLYVINAKKT